MRREYYNYIKESVKNNLNKKLLNEDWGGLGISDIYEYRLPWPPPGGVGFDNDNNWPPPGGVGFDNDNTRPDWPPPGGVGFDNDNTQPDPTRPPQAPIDRGTFESPTPNSFPVIYREEPPGSGQYYKYRLVRHPQLGWGYQRVPVPAGGAGFTWGDNLPVGIIIWNEDDAQFQKYTRPTGWDWLRDLPNYRQNAPTRLAPSVPTPRR
jgi:hypothetical protein